MDHRVSVKKRDARHTPFRFELRPPSPVRGGGGGSELARVRSDEPCDSSTVHGRDAIEPVSAIEPIVPCSPTCPFSPRASKRKYRARCPRSAFEPARAPLCPRAQERDEEWYGFTPHHSLGRAICFHLRSANVVGSGSACGRSPGSFVASGLSPVGLDRFRCAP